LLLDFQDFLCWESRERPIVSLNDALEGEVQIFSEMVEEETYLDIVLDVVIARTFELGSCIKV
jgi:hypothetical protein